MSGKRAFHVTERETAALILEQGFLGGWGDIGFGVYLWTDEAVARAYAKEGGWDGLLTDPVILVVEDASLRPIEAWEIHPDWDPKPYRSMLWRPMGEDDPDMTWRPDHLYFLDIPSPEPEPGS
ncbi:MAG: hypothetical protein KC466_01730 [Myxococcales bacterium]|nr:hypothetical protein [Myxococcales bacterium]